MISALVLLAAQQERPPSIEEILIGFTTEAKAEARARRPDLIPYAEPIPSGHAGGLSTEARDAAARQIRAAWGAGRTVEALAVARRTASRAGTEDGEIVEDLVQILLRTGHWAEARDLVGVNLTPGWPYHRVRRYALAATEAEGGAVAGPDSGFDRTLRMIFARDWDATPAEIDRVYPATPEGRRRLAWAVYASSAARRAEIPPTSSGSDGAVVGETFSGEERRTLVALELDEPWWATREAFRRYPDDPIAAYWASFGGHLVRDSGLSLVTREEQRRIVAERTPLFAPALRRLRKGDALERLLRERTTPRVNVPWSRSRPGN